MNYVFNGLQVRTFSNPPGIQGVFYNVRAIDTLKIINKGQMIFWSKASILNTKQIFFSIWLLGAIFFFQIFPTFFLLNIFKIKTFETFFAREAFT